MNRFISKLSSISPSLVTRVAIGNEAADLDSIASAIVFAAAEGAYPIVAIERGDIPLRTGWFYCL